MDKKAVFWYGLALAGLLILMKLLEYQFLVRTLSIEVYLTVVAVVFTSLGIWLALQLTRRAKDAGKVEKDTEVACQDHSLSERELSVLRLMAQGMSNQEIADQLYISIHTVKTHSSNLFSKLDVRNRTMAVARARNMGIVN